MTVALLSISDGRHAYHAAACESALEHLPAFDQYIFVHDPDHRLGFAGAVQQGWQQVETDHVFHFEADFTFNRAVPVSAMVDVLNAHPHLVQMALLRQPWNGAERAAGGIWQQHPDEYEHRDRNGHRWLEHRRFVTTNPCIWPRRVIDRGWPQRDQSEGHFGLELFESDHSLRAAFWGEGEEWVHHIGGERAGGGY